MFQKFYFRKHGNLFFAFSNVYQFEYKSNFKQAHSTELQFGKSFPSVADVSEVFDYSVKDYT